MGITPTRGGGGGGGGGCGGSGGGGGGSLEPLVFPAAANGDISESTTFSPVPLASFTKMSRLRLVVIIVVTELCVFRSTSWTCQWL